MKSLHVLCAGAVKGLVLALQSSFERDAGAPIVATFGAVGAMRDALRSGAPCDVLIVTERMVADLIASGELRAGSDARIGSVRTAVAVPSGAPHPALDDAQAVKAALLASSALYVPDLVLSTAGAHVASMLDALGIRQALESRLRMSPSGAIAMRALADDGLDGAVGCTQATEIRYTPGLDLVGLLPEPFALATVYSAALAGGASDVALAARFLAVLGGPPSRELRLAGGFDLPAADAA